MEKTVSRFRGKLVKMIKDAGNKFDELTEKYFFLTQFQTIIYVTNEFKN